LLVVILTTTILIAVLQIFLRNVMHSGIADADTLVRILVLWLGLVGAMIASRERRHIKIDILTQRMSPKWSQITSYITNLVASIVCAVIAWYGYQFVLFEYEDGLTAFASVPAWVAESIIPFAFTVMALRYAAYIFIDKPSQPHR
jgi:TRAP-type C4-dicarboxylate transport system permease small subunit